MTERTFMIDTGTTLIQFKSSLFLKTCLSKKIENFSLDAFYRFVPDKAEESAPATSCHKSSHDDQSVSCDINKVKKLSN